MTSKKGFTLMELLVAVFISGMVTVALAAVWRAASLQTSQSQRQTILKNNVTIFLREMHRNISEADIIFFPSPENNNKEYIIGGRRVYKIDKDNWSAYCLSEDSRLYQCNGEDLSEPKFFNYCYEDEKIYYQEASKGGTSGTIDSLDTFTCSSGTVVLTNVTYFNVKALDNATFEVALKINKDFGDGTTPIKLSIIKEFTSAGGL